MRIRTNARENQIHLFPVGFLSEPFDDEGIERRIIDEGRRRRGRCRWWCPCCRRRGGTGFLLVCWRARADHRGAVARGPLEEEQKERERKKNLSVFGPEKRMQTDFFLHFRPIFFTFFSLFFRGKKRTNAIDNRSRLAVRTESLHQRSPKRRLYLLLYSIVSRK